MWEVLGEQAANEVVRTVIIRTRRSFMLRDLSLGQTCDQTGGEFRGLILTVWTVRMGSV